MNAKAPIRIAYITVTDPRDKHSWSGTDHYISKTLSEQGCDLHFLGPAQPRLITLITKAWHGISQVVFGKRFDYRHSTLYAKACGHLFGRKLRRGQYDLVFAPGGVALTAYLKTQLPIVLVVDRTIAGAIGYHPLFQSLWKFSERQSIRTDQKAMLASAACIYSSAWAANAALQHYGMPASKVKILPFGANLDQVPSRESITKTYHPNRCSLLFIGVHWENKGGPIALACLNELLARGVDAHLTVVGSNPPELAAHAHATVYPFLNKNKAKDFDTLGRLYREATFFILPTRLEAFGIVYCEAAAFGVPSLGTNTGGVSSAIVEGKTGYLMPFEADGKAYADTLQRLLGNEAAYLQLCRSARDTFERELNWDVWGQQVSALCGKLAHTHSLQKKASQKQ